MPAVITFDIKKATTKERNRVQSFFERLGWENLGGSSYRYPRLGSDQPTEDWMHHVIPALMLFRAFIVKRDVTLKKLTLAGQSSTPFTPESRYATTPPPAP